MLRSVLFVSGFIGLAACTSDVAEPQPEVLEFPALTLTDFSHEGNSTAVLTFNHDALGEVAYRLDGDDPRIIASEDGIVRIDYYADAPDGDGVLDEQSYVLEFQDANDQPHSIELIRQSPGELLEAFEFDKVDGYTILGSNTLLFSNGDVDSAHVLDRSYSEDFTVNDAVANADLIYPELHIAADIVGTLYAQPLSFGPRDRGGAKSLIEEIENIRNGADGIQCAGFRELWGHASEDHGLIFRYVGLYSYAPYFDDLTPYSHAIAEVMTDDGWKAIDPWNNAAFRVRERYVSAEELRQAVKREPATVEIVMLNPGLEKIILGADGSTTSTLIKFPERDFYFNYFGAIETVDVTFTSG